MFDIGFQELIIIFLVALIVFGPQKLPEIGQTLGRWMVEIRRGINHAKAQVESELNEAYKDSGKPAKNLPEEDTQGEKKVDSTEKKETI